MSITVGIIAGEASGDALGAGLIEALRQRFPDARFVGVTGPRMRSAGCDTWLDAEELAVMGLVEVLRHLPRLLRRRRQLTKRFLQRRPDVVIGIDAPDFTLGVEARLRAAGITTVHYVSPSIWAWRAGRIRTIERAADLVLCLLPFEPDCYREARCEARFIGHPLADALRPPVSRHQAKQAVGLTAETPALALLPGSRGGEVGRHAALFLQAAQRLQSHVPGLRVLIPAANEKRLDQLKNVVEQHGAGLAVELATGQAQAYLAAADVALVASGTATLETMLLDTPMVVAYRLSPVTAWLFRRFGGLRTRYFALPNLIAGERIVPECLQEAATVETLFEASLALFDPVNASRQREAFARQRSVLRQNASHQAAEAIAQLLERKKETV